MRFKLITIIVIMLCNYAWLNAQTTINVPADHVTIQAAVDAAAPGDIINVAAGTYTEQVTITKSLSLIGAGEATTTIAAMPARAGTIVYGADTWDYILAAHALAGTIDVRVQGFTFDANAIPKQGGANKYAGVLFLDVNGPSAGLLSSTIEDWIPIDYESWGVAVYGNSNLTIDDNTLTDYTRDGILVYGDDGAGADPDVIINNNDLTGSAIPLNGISIGLGAAGTISNNTIQNHTRSAPWAAVGIIVNKSDGINVLNNTVQNSHYGIDLLQSDNCTVDQNILTDNNAIYMLIDNSDNNSIKDNTINGRAAGTDNSGIHLSQGSTGNIIGGPAAADGNTITMASAGSGLLYCIYLPGTVGAGSNTIQNNVIDGGKRAVQIDGGNSGTTTIEDNTIGSGAAPSFSGIYLNAGSAIISDNTLINSVRPIEFWGAVNVTVSDNVINGSTFDGMNCGNASGVISISGNEIYNIPDWHFAIHCRPDADNTTIDDNEIYDSHRGISVESGCTGVSITDNYIHNNGFSAMELHETVSTITGNTLSANERGIETWSPITANNNNILSHTFGGIILHHAGPHNAEFNWWGSATGPSGTGYPGTGTLINDNGNDIDYTPWLGAVIGTTPMTYGVDPDDSASLGEAVTASSNGDVIQVTGGANTYDAITITKSITLQGTGGARIDHGSPAIIVNANNVTITGFTFDFTTADYAIQVNNGITGTQIHNCFFLTTNGVNNLTLGADIVDAENNWWGTTDGPGGAGPGTGSNVSANVDYTPWLLWWGTANTPINGLSGISVEPTFNWDALPNAASYKLYVDDASDFTTPLYEVDEGTNLTKLMSEVINNFPLDNSTLYYWKVAAIVNATEYDSENWHFTTVPNVPVYQSFPSDGGLIYGTTAELSWYTLQATGTMKYKVQIILDESLASPGSAPLATEWTGSTSSTVTDLNTAFSVLGGKKYWWRISVLNASDEVISYSSVFSFDVVGGTNITLYQTWPVGNPTMYTNTPTCHWYASQNTAGTTYAVWYNTAGDDEGTPDGHIDSDDTGAAIASAGSDLNKELPALTPGQKYYWSVAATYNGETVYSGIESFTTNGAGTLSKPLITYPLGGITVYTTSPDVYWYPSGQAAGLTFKVYYRDKAVGGAYTEATGGVATSDLNYQLTGLIAGNTYEFYVEAISITGTMDSDVEEFVVNAALANGHPVASWPLASIEYTTTPELHWYLEGASTGLSYYTVKWYKGSAAPADWTTVLGSTADAGTFDIHTLTTTSYVIPVDLDYGEEYQWAVASHDGTIYSAWSEGSFTVYGSTAVAPTQTSPNNNSTIMDRTPTLYWVVNGSTVGLTSYTLVYSSSDVFAAGVTTTVPNLTDNFYEIQTNLTPGTTYHWYVTAVYSQGSAASATFKFTVDPGASSVQPFVGGPNNVDVSTTSPMLSWVVPVPSESALSFQLEVAGNVEFTNSMVYQGITTPYQIVSGLQEGMEYFWRVKSSTISGDQSFYSGTGSFKVIGSSITGVEDDDIIPNDFMVMQNYPNPFNPTTTINYSIPEASFVSVKVYDMLGREVKVLVNSNMVAGIHSVNWNGKDNYGNAVSSGTYIYRVVTGNNTAVKKMILLK